MKKNKKLLALVCCMTLLVGAVGATLAWLTDTSGPVNNTFTVGDVDINMDETNVDNTLTGKIRDTENSYKMIPGFTIDKDPIITITPDSEPCWVFVKLEKVNDFDSFLKYEMEEGWTLVQGQTNVYGKKIMTPENYSTIITGLHVLKGDQVVVKDNVTKEMMDGLNENNLPKLILNAYAVQLYETNEEEFTAVEAWAKVTP